MKKTNLFLFFAFSSFTAFLIPILKFNTSFIARDWGLFNSNNLFNYSCWNNYNTFPMHNPYILGGMDNFGNPQSKVASPLQIFDYLLKAPYGNLISLITLSIIGAFGFYFLLKHLKISKNINIALSFIFIHASWFHLHFGEGHIIFGSFMLFGWITLSILRINENKYKLILALISAFMLLDGGMYAFIYTIILFFLLHLFKIETLSFKKLFNNINENKFYCTICVLIWIGLSSFKLIPMIMLHGNRMPIVENISLDFKSILYSFLYPFAHIQLKIPFTNYRSFIGYHELGAYVGIISLLIILAYLIKNFNSRNIKYTLLISFFLWVGSGWFDPVNPWRIFQQIPLLNNAHVQTRALFFVYLFCMVLLAFGLEWLYMYIPVIQCQSFR